MRHALIIDDNAVISRGMQNRLQAFGFNSFDHAWSERQALEAVTRHSPDLIVIGDTVAGGSSIEVARKVAAKTEAPVLAVTADRCSFSRSVPSGATVEGPFRLTELDAALALAGAA